jgi:hypothetical protein
MKTNTFNEGLQRHNFCSTVSEHSEVTKQKLKLVQYFR